MTDRRCCAEPPRQNTAALARKRDYDRILVIGSSDASEGSSRARRGRAAPRFASTSLPPSECSLPRLARGPAQHPGEPGIPTVSLDGIRLLLFPLPLFLVSSSSPPASVPRRGYSSPRDILLSGLAILRPRIRGALRAPAFIRPRFITAPRPAEKLCTLARSVFRALDPVF